MKNYFNLFAFFLLLASPKYIFSQTPQWHYLGDTIIEQTWGTGVLTSLEGDAPYVAYPVYDNSDFFWKIKRFDGFSWMDVDTNGLGFQNFRILGTTASGVLQIAYLNSEGNKIGIKRLMGGTWEIISESPLIADIPYNASYDFDNERLFIAFADQNLSNGEKITVWKYDTGVWSVVGQPGFSIGNAYPIILKVDNGIPWVAYEDWALGRAGIVKKFDGNTWQSVGGQVFDGDPHGRSDFTVSNGIPYIVHADSSTQSRASVLKFDGANWSTIGPPMFTEPTSFVKLAIDDNIQEPYLLFEDYDPAFWGLSALRFNGTAWDFVGSRGFIYNYWSLEFIIKDGVPHVGYERSPFGGGGSVQVFSPVSHTITPDAGNISFKISPNPLTNDVLQMKIQSSRASDVRAQIFDMDGRLLQSASWHINAGPSDQQINVDTLAKGVYVIQLKSKDGRELYSKQFVVVR